MVDKAGLFLCAQARKENFITIVLDWYGALQNSSAMNADFNDFREENERCRFMMN
jgi:hypothetical protein